MNDLISRSALLAELDEIEPAEDYEYEHDTWLDCRLEAIHAPAVDAVEVVHGRWIDEVELRPELYGWVPLNSVVCSVCNKSNSRETDYCPNCGAKMDGGKDDG